MNTCKTCKHFRPGSYKDERGKGFGHCERWRYGYRERVEDCPTNELIVENDEGWGAIMGPDFGCVLWEGK